MRNRRLLVSLAAVLILLAVGGSVVFIRSQTLDKRALEFRAKGMEAAGAGDYVTALDQVGRYLQRFGQDSDAEALFAYAQARRNVPMPNAKHLYDSIGVLRRTLDVDPNHPQARQELLELYLVLGYGQETLALARQILERDPGNVPALRAEAIALGRLGEYEQALSQTAVVADLAPEDIANHNLALQIMDRLRRPKESLLAYADNEPGLDPEKAPYQLVKAAAHERVGDREGAIVWAERAAQSVPDNVELVLFTDKLLSSLNRHQSALKLLEAATGKIGDPELERLLVRRLFEAGNIPEFMKRTDEVPSTKQDATLLALRAVGFAYLDETGKIQGIVNELESRKNDNGAKAWVPLLKAKFLQDDTPQNVLVVCKEAIRREPASPYFHYFLGWAYEQLREPGLALQTWDQARQLSPGWVDPVLRSAAVMSSTGRTDEANRLALAALDRAPQNVEVATIAATILGTDIETLSEQGREQLFELVESLQASNPMEPRTLPLYIALLARRSGPGEAKAKVEAALESGRALSQDTLLQLARVSDTIDLGIAEACRERIERTMGPTVSLAYARAVEAHEEGDSERGRKLLVEEARAAGNTGEWLAAVAQYLELTGADDAPAAWAKASDAAPENVALQQRVLASNAAWRDPAVVERVIERLKKATGEDGAAWRAAKAQWLLATDDSAKAAAEASALMTDAMSAALPNALYHTTLATALERLGDAEGALDNLAHAAQLDPKSNAIKFELVRLHQSRGNFLEAEPYLEQIARSGSVSPEDARRLAELFANQGQVDRAIDVLLSSYPPEERENAADLLLARLYRGSGQLDKAEAVAQRLLEGSPDAAAIGFTADLLALRGQTDRARAVLARLDEMTLKPGMRESVLAEYERSHGTAEEAKRLYEAALAADRGNPALWRRYIDFAVRNGEPERAVAMMGEAHAACPDERLFTELAANRDLLASVAVRQAAQPFLVAVVNTPERFPEILECLKAIHEVPGGDSARLAIELLQLSNRYPRFLPLKLQLARLYSSLGRHTDAARIASQAMRDFPGGAEAARLAAETLTEAGQWEEALRAAGEWRRCSAGRPMEADFLIAGAQIELGRPAEALETLRPYLQELDRDYKTYSPLPLLYARALLASGRMEEARELLAPRLEASEQWRVAWIRLAGTSISDEVVATEWLQRVTPLLAKGSLDEHMALAAAWYKLADRSGDASCRDRARQTLESLSSVQGGSPRALLGLGVIAERDRNYPKAEATYRLALQLDPGLAVAKNNLAMLLANRGEELDEAMRLAQEAVQAEPGNASFVDTLGSVCAARGDYDAAIEQLKRAVELEPREQQWRDRLADLEKRQREAAQAAEPAALPVG